ncbi:MAG: hypothetical protein BWK80_26370 [Desulfobacteraceae bacterium IS3]|nr:MAG: hypothetical protein BWK80_26370 [Desulfobacteraceae bacterium IS3]
MKNIFAKCLCLSIVTFFAINGYAKEPLQPVTVQLNWVPNVQFAGILVAKEKGWYEESGIDLTIKGWAEGVVPVLDVVAGKAQVAVADSAELIRFRVRGSTVKAIGTAFRKSPSCLLSLKAKGIETPKDLVGKKVGINNPESVVTISIMLKSQGLRYEDIIPVKVGWDFQPLIDGTIDVYTAFMNNEPLTMKKMGYDVTYMPGFKYGYDFYSGLYVVSDKMIQQNPRIVQNFLSATLRGWKEAFKDPAAAAKLIIAKYYPEGDAEQQTESLKVFKYLATFGIGEQLIGFMEEEIWEKAINLLYEYKEIDKKIPASDVFTLEFLKK